MRFRVVVESRRVDPAELFVEASPGHTHGEVADVIAKSLRLGPAAWILRSARAVSPASRDLTLGECPLLQGDTLRLEEVGSDAGFPSEQLLGADGLTLVVTGGSRTGQSVDLRSGATTVGRSEGCSLVIEDQRMSRSHFQVVVTTGEIWVEDLGSANGTFIDGRRLQGPTAIRSGATIEAGSTLFRLVVVSEVEPLITPSPAGTIPFNRPPRAAQPPSGRTFHVPAPPEEQKKRRIPLASSLVPLVMGVVMALVLGQPALLGFALLSPVMAIWSVVEDRRGGRREHQQKRREFDELFNRLTEDLEAAQQAETDSRRSAAPDAAAISAIAATRDRSLWQRRPRDSDFLELRVGWGDQPSSSIVEFDRQANARLIEPLQERLAPLLTLPAVPVTVNLRDAGVLGVAGERPPVESLARWLLEQLGALHSPRDVALYLALAEPNAASLEGMSFLPHFDPPEPPLDGDSLVVGSGPTRELVERISRLIRAREEAATSLLATSTDLSPCLVVVLDGELPVPRSTIAPILEKGPAHGVFTIWLGDLVDDLPGECGMIVELEGDGQGVTLTDPRAGVVRRGLIADQRSLDDATSTARHLSPVRDLSAGSQRAQIPRRVSLLEITGCDDLRPETVLDRWSTALPGVDAPVGLGATAPFVVDMRRDGPHGLLGGTTGAGKSEFLQSLVVSLAVHHPPEQLAFILIDYKGGAAFKDCVALPHTIGFVTDLDRHLVHRALVSLNAELQRREHLLAAVGARDIIEMERREPDRVPPNLLLVIDEFAALVKELPEFVEGIVDVAQRGRSLGIHLLLATQRPAGSINDNIRANTNLRMALRMNDVADSQDVIDIKDAALLPRSLPGRALARTGHGEITEFQVAYGGGWTADADGGDTEPLRVVLARHGRPVDGAAHAEGDDTKPTDLQRVVGTIRQAFERLGAPPPSPPWLPALPSVLPIDDPRLPASAGSAVLGLADLPAQQEQRAFHFEPARDGSLLIYGRSGSGKTTIARSLVASMTRTMGPRHLNVYALDFGARALGSLASLPQCGAVVSGDDVERMQRVIALIEHHMSERRQVFARTGATSIDEYVAGGEPEGPLPRLVVVIDGYGGFDAVFEKIDYGAILDRLPQLVSDGRALGVHWLITADRRSAVSSGLSSVVPVVLALSLTSLDDFSSLGFDSRQIGDAQLPPGRGYLTGTIEIQTPILGRDPAGDAQVRAMEQLGAQLTTTYPDERAPTVGSLPTEVLLDDLPDPDGHLRPMIGVGGLLVQPLSISLHDGHFVVAGPIRSGKSTALGTIARSLRAAGPDLDLHLMAPRRSPLSDLDVWTSTALGEAACADLATTIKEAVDNRDWGAEPMIVVIDDAAELGESAAARSLEAIAKKARDVGVLLIVAAEASAILRAYSGWLPELRKDRHGLLLQPDPEMDGELFGVQLPRSARNFPAGRGYLIEDGTATPVQCALY